MNPRLHFQWLIWLAMFACAVPGTSAPASSPPAPAKLEDRFPLRVSDNQRHLVDRHGRPFFYLADTGWDLTMYANEQDVRDYLDDRQARGFNAIQVMLTGNRIDTPNTRGDLPFHDADLTRPNPAFFAHVKWFLREAAARELLVVGSAGWFGINGECYFRYTTEADASAYGKFLGEYFIEHDNLILFLGGDRHPNTTPGETHGTKAAVNAMGNAIKRADPRRLLSYHAQSKSSKNFHESPWLDFNMIQVHAIDDPKYYRDTLDDYLRSPTKPTLLAEGAYEGELRSLPRHIRSGAYWSTLAGSFGVAYGNGKTYRVRSAQQRPWRDHLDTPGTRQVMHLRDLFLSLPWHTLEPDLAGLLVRQGAGEAREFATAAMSAARDVAVVFVPTRRELTIAIHELRGAVTARWFDPTDGSYRPINTYPAGGEAVTVQLTPPAANHAGDADFLLVLTSDSSAK